MYLSKIYKIKTNVKIYMVSEINFFFVLGRTVFKTSIAKCRHLTRKSFATPEQFKHLIPALHYGSIYQRRGLVCHTAAGRRNTVIF